MYGTEKHHIVFRDHSSRWLCGEPSCVQNHKRFCYICKIRFDIRLVDFSKFVP